MAQKWEQKDNLCTMTSKFNDAVQELEDLKESSTQVNEATEERFTQMEQSVSEQFHQVNEELEKKVSSVTAEDLGLGEVDNTSDIDKPVSTAQQKAIDDAIDKFADEFTQEIPGDDPIGDDPEVSTPVKRYIDEKIKDAVAHVGIGVASETVLGGVKASEDIAVDPTTGKATVKGYAEQKKLISSIKESLNSNNEVTQKLLDNQGTLEQLQTTEKTSLVGAINETFQLGSERKAKLVENLTAMRVSCSTSDTWESLLAKVLDIFTGTDTSEGNLVAANLLYDKIGFGADGKVVGTMPNRSIPKTKGGQGDDIVGASWPDQAISHATLTQYAKYGADNTEKLIVRPPTGYYDEKLHARVYVNPNELAAAIGLTAGKLVKGLVVLGITGTGQTSANEPTFVEIDRADSSVFNPTSWTYEELLNSGFNAIMMVAYPTYNFKNVATRNTGSIFWTWGDLYEKASEISSGYKNQSINFGGITYGNLQVYKDHIIMTRNNSSYGLQLFGIKNMVEP